MLNNIGMFYEARERVINLFHDCATIASEVNFEATQEKESKY